MKPTSPAQRVHFKLSTTLPSRTHTWEPAQVNWGEKRAPSEMLALRARLLDARERGMRMVQMSAEFKCSSRTIIKLIGHKKK